MVLVQQAAIDLQENLCHRCGDCVAPLVTLPVLPVLPALSLEVPYPPASTIAA